VDQLSAAIGLTLMLNKMGKHGTAVFSGKVPSTIEFLQPENTLEKNTDSLRDFIIALDKSKADKLRYKVEDSHVKIFITPYRTSISEKDLDFSQGDFNVEVVVALGVADQKDLDKAITAHGRILHDATTISVTNGTSSELGSIDWDQADASSLCEMIASLAPDLGNDVLDGQIATALMTGVVAETERFRNAKTSSATMSISAALMNAGANQQLVASKLDGVTDSSSPSDQVVNDDQQPQSEEDGALQINHNPELPDEETDSDEDQSFEEEIEMPELPELEIPNEDQADDQSQENQPFDNNEPSENNEPESRIIGGGSFVSEPPTLGGTLTANATPEGLDPSSDPMSSNRFDQPLLSRDEQEQTQDEPPIEEPVDLPAPSMDLPSDLPPPSIEPSTPAEVSPPEAPDHPPQEPVPEELVIEDEAPEDDQEKTLTELEAVVQGSYNAPPMMPPQPSPDMNIQPPLPNEPITPPPDVSGARDAVMDALVDSNEPPSPIAALNAQPLDLNVQANSNTPVNSFDQPPVPEFTMPDNLMPPPMPMDDPTAAAVQDPTAAPAVPPPFMPGAVDFNTDMPSPSPLMDTDQQNSPAYDPNNPLGLPPS
jgi:hypothetical protein